MVAEETNTAPAGIAAAAPCSPNSTASVCAALTTAETTIPAPAAAASGVVAPRPPAAAKRSTAPRSTSQPATSKPARRSEFAIPSPIEPRPMTAALGPESMEFLSPFGRHHDATAGSAPSFAGGLEPQIERRHASRVGDQVDLEDAAVLDHELEHHEQIGS